LRLHLGRRLPRAKRQEGARKSGLDIQDGMDFACHLARASCRRTSHFSSLAARRGDTWRTARQPLCPRGTQHVTPTRTRTHLRTGCDCDHGNMPGHAGINICALRQQTRHSPAHYAHTSLVRRFAANVMAGGFAGTVMINGILHVVIRTISLA